MAWLPLRCPRMPQRAIPTVTSPRLHCPVSTASLPLTLLDSVVQVPPYAVNALEGNNAYQSPSAAALRLVARQNGLAHSASSTHLLQWSLHVLCLVPLGILLQNIATSLLSKRASKLQQPVLSSRVHGCIIDSLQKADVKRQCLHGVDISNSQYLQRPNVEAAVQFAEQAHHGQKRKTGDPYITHCIHTALILEDLLDASLDDNRFETAMICAVLHDVLDDTDITKEQLMDKFGEPIAVAVSQISIMSRDTQSLRRRQRQKAR